MAWRITDVKSGKEDYGMDLRSLTCAMKKLTPKEEFENFVDETYEGCNIEDKIPFTAKTLKEAYPDMYLEFFDDYVRCAAKSIFEDCPEDPDHEIVWSGLKIEWLDRVCPWKERDK